MQLYNAKAITVSTIAAGNPVGVVGAAAAGVHRSLLAKHLHPSTARFAYEWAATDAAMRGRSSHLSEGIKLSDAMLSCPAFFQQLEPTDCRMLRRGRTWERPAGDPTVRRWSTLRN